MKKYIIVRHAQALDLNKWFTHDFYRTLTKKWENQARKISQELKKLSLKPDIIISSTAPRAYQTVSIIANDLHINHEKVILHSECYHANKNKRIEVISYYQANNIILICGHNPELLQLCQHYNSNIKTLKKWQYYIFDIEHE